MRIAFVQRGYRSDGGAERFLRLLMERLAQEGHEVHLFAHRWSAVHSPPSTVNVPFAIPSDPRPQTLDPRIVFHRVPVVPGSSFLRVLSFALFATRMAKEGGYDLVHSFERIFSMDIYRAGEGCHREWLLKRRRIEPFLRWALHWFNPLHRTLLALERRIFAGGGARLIVANSKRGKEEIIRHYGTPPEKIEVLYNGVDLKQFSVQDRKPLREQVRSEWGIGPEEILILFLGSGFQRKGLRFLVEAFALLAKRASFMKVRLLVVGKGDPAPYEKLADRLGIGDQVLFAGPVTSPQGFYAAADLFVLPTLYDPFSNASLEAMAAGLPVITSRMNGASELLEGGRGGAVLQDPLDPEVLASHLLSFLDREAREIAGGEALTIAQGFGIEEHVKKVLGLYERLLEGGRGW